MGRHFSFFVIFLLATVSIQRCQVKVGGANKLCKCDLA